MDALNCLDSVHTCEAPLRCERLSEPFNEPFKHCADNIVFPLPVLSEQKKIEYKIMPIVYLWVP